MAFTYNGPSLSKSIPPAQILLAFMISVVAGARRVANTDWLRRTRPSTLRWASSDSPAPTPCAISFSAFVKATSKSSGGRFRNGC